MASSGAAQHPAEYERVYLTRLEREYQQFTASPAAPNRMPTAQEIAAHINLLGAWLQYLQTYESLSQYLLNSGLGQMSLRLAQMRTDIEGALGIYSQIQQSMLNYQAQNAQVWAETNQECTRIIMETNARRQEVFEKCQEMWNMRWS